MRFFIDTADVNEIKAANDMGVICGVTTNQSLIAKEGRDFNQVIKEITDIVDGPISGEVKATTVDAEGMIKEGREIAAIHPNMVVKIPMTAEGLKAVKVLSAEGIKTNVTLLFTANQAILNGLIDRIYRFGEAVDAMKNENDLSSSEIVHYYPKKQKSFSSYLKYAMKQKANNLYENELRNAMPDIPYPAFYFHQ